MTGPLTGPDLVAYAAGTICGDLAREFPGVDFTWTSSLGYRADFGDGSDPAVSSSPSALRCFVALTLQRRDA